jgi:transaldolase
MRKRRQSLRLAGSDPGYSVWARWDMTTRLSDLQVKLFADGADKAQIIEMAKQPWIRGFTTNPSLLKKAGVSDYEAYARDLISAVPDRHISFEVFSDDISEMMAQARAIATWGGNVYVKLPVTTTSGEPLFEAVDALSHDGIRVNMTAIFTSDQVARAVDALVGGAPACVSVFAGRLADLGIDYRPAMEDAISRARATPNVEIIWASTREIFNVVEADALSHHHGACQFVEETAGHGIENRRRAVSRRSPAVSRGCACRQSYA